VFEIDVQNIAIGLMKAHHRSNVNSVHVNAFPWLVASKRRERSKRSLEPNVASLQKIRDHEADIFYIVTQYIAIYMRGNVSERSWHEIPLNLSSHRKVSLSSFSSKITAYVEQKRGETGE